MITFSKIFKSKTRVVCLLLSRWRIDILKNRKFSILFWTQTLSSPQNKIFTWSQLNNKAINPNTPIESNKEMSINRFINRYKIELQKKFIWSNKNRIFFSLIYFLCFSLSALFLANIKTNYLNHNNAYLSRGKKQVGIIFLFFRIENRKRLKKKQKLLVVRCKTRRRIFPIFVVPNVACFSSVRYSKEKTYKFSESFIKMTQIKKSINQIHLLSISNWVALVRFELFMSP